MSETKNVRAKIILSMPRIGFTKTFCDLLHTVGKLRIPVEINTGVFWGASLQSLLESCVKDETDYAITVDYDSVFVPEDVQDLLSLAVSNPQLLAIFPLQMRQDATTPLFQMIDETTGKHIQMTDLKSFYSKQLHENVVSGHFGLTVINIALLKKMSKPWFLNVPDKNGEYQQGVINYSTGQREEKFIPEDIYFWNKAVKEGFKFALSPIRIGHLNQFVVFPSEKMVPMFLVPSQVYDIRKNNGEASWTAGFSRDGCRVDLETGELVVPIKSNNQEIMEKLNKIETLLNSQEKSNQASQFPSPPPTLKGN